MKKLIIAVLIAVMIPVIALADVDLASMSFEELVKLREQIIAEIINRPEWKETEIDAGTYRIGKDIPSGVYTVIPKNTYVMLNVYDGSKFVNGYGVYGEEIGRLPLYDGYRLEIDATIILTPYTGI